MHPFRRIALLAVLVTAIVPFVGTSVLLSSVKTDLEEEFQQALEKAQTSYQSRTTRIRTVVKQAEKKSLTEIGKQLALLARQKREVRFEIARLRPATQDLRNAVGLAVQERQRIARLADMEERRFAELLKSGRLAAFVGDEKPAVDLRVVFRHLLSLALGAEIQGDMQDSFTQRAHERFLVSVKRQLADADASLDVLRSRAAESAAELTAAEDKRERLLISYRALDREYDALSSSSRAVSDEEFAAIKAEMASVHADVMRIQSELARIDARERERVVRELIAKGLMDPQEGGATVRMPKLKFAWPVYGRITAGFHDEAYRKHFGVPHQAIDIAQPQGSPVGAAADGVVLVVRDGGKRGYSYILIGHRDGYATLYGHISRIGVSAGQDVRQGTVVGLSGGQPGTPGAGLLTSGPHVHFEVIKQGININPLTMLQ